MDRSRQKIGFLPVLILPVILVLGYLMNEPDDNLKTAEILEAKLDLEKDILSRTCEQLINLDKDISHGSLTFLGSKLTTLEELLVGAKSFACVAANKTRVVLEKIIRLEQTKLFQDCTQNNDCEQMLPALKDLENHFENRMSNIEELKVYSKQINDLIPSSSDNFKEFNEASSIVKNFYICIDFIFSEIPNLYKLVFNSDNIEEQSAFQSFILFIVQMGFRLLLIGTVFMIAPKTIWKLHLFIMKTLIIFSIMVLCVGFYNYFSSFILSLQHRSLRGQIDENNMDINFVRFTKNIWAVEQFKEAKIQRNIDLMNKENQQIYNWMKPDIPVKSFTYNEVFLENIETELNRLKKIDNKEYNDLAVDVRLVLEKHRPVLKTVVDTIHKCFNIYVYEKDLLQKVQNKSETAEFLLEIVPNLIEIEEDIVNYKLKINAQIKKMNKLEKEIALFEESNGQTVKRAGTLSGLLGVFSLPYLSKNYFGSFGVLGLAGTFYAHSVAKYKNTILTSIKNVTSSYKLVCKDLLEILDMIDIMKLRSALSVIDVDIITSEDDVANNYYDEVQDMLIENIHEVNQAIEIIQNLQ